MSAFDVVIKETWQVERRATVTVDADNEDEARQKALKAREDGDCTDLWGREHEGDETTVTVESVTGSDEE